MLPTPPFHETPIPGIGFTRRQYPNGQVQVLDAHGTPQPTNATLAHVYDGNGNFMSLYGDALWKPSFPDGITSPAFAIAQADDRNGHNDYVQPLPLGGGSNAFVGNNAYGNAPQQVGRAPITGTDYSWATYLGGAPANLFHANGMPTPNVGTATRYPDAVKAAGQNLQQFNPHSVPPAGVTRSQPVPGTPVNSLERFPSGGQVPDRTAYSSVANAIGRHAAWQPRSGPIAASAANWTPMPEGIRSSLSNTLQGTAPYAPAGHVPPPPMPPASYGKPLLKASNHAPSGYRTQAFGRTNGQPLTGSQFDRDSTNFGGVVSRPVVNGITVAHFKKTGGMPYFYGAQGQRLLPGDPRVDAYIGASHPSLVFSGPAEIAQGIQDAWRSAGQNAGNAAQAWTDDFLRSHGQHNGVARIGGEVVGNTIKGATNFAAGLPDFAAGAMNMASQEAATGMLKLRGGISRMQGNVASAQRDDALREQLNNDIANETRQLGAGFVQGFGGAGPQSPLGKTFGAVRALANADPKTAAKLMQDAASLTGRNILKDPFAAAMNVTMVGGLASATGMAEAGARGAMMERMAQGLDRAASAADRSDPAAAAAARAKAVELRTAEGRIAQARTAASAIAQRAASIASKPWRRSWKDLFDEEAATSGKSDVPGLFPRGGDKPVGKQAPKATPKPAEESTPGPSDYEPNGRNLSDLFVVRPGPAMADVQSAVNSAARVHGVDEAMPRIHVKTHETIDDLTAGSKFKTYGNYHRDIHDDKNTHFSVAADHRWPGTGSLHELGHFIDDHIYPHKDGEFPSATAPELNDWRTAVDNTDQVKALRQSLKTGKIRYIDGHGVPRMRRIDSDYVRYLLNREELFARSYAEYVARRCNNPVLSRELNDMMDSGEGRAYGTQWGPTFAPIEAAFDKLFEEKQWIKGKTAKS